LVGAKYDVFVQRGLILANGAKPASRWIILRDSLARPRILSLPKIETGFQASSG
jgi:hypothetical protein